MSDRSPKKLVYRPEVFEARDLGFARAIILTPENDTTTDERWEFETPYVVGEIGRLLKPGADDCVLDYGCGVGRIAKGLIDRHGCRVVGVDISARMRELALAYVGSDRFEAISPDELAERVEHGLRAAGAVACWVLQHALRPDEDLARIESALAPNGRLFVLNQIQRAVPSSVGWVDDGISVEALLRARFDVIERDKLPEVVSTEQLAARSYTMLLGKRGR